MCNILYFKLLKKKNNNFFKIKHLGLSLIKNGSGPIIIIAIHISFNY